MKRQGVATYMALLLTGWCYLSYGWSSWDTLTKAFDTFLKALEFSLHVNFWSVIFNKI